MKKEYSVKKAFTICFALVFILSVALVVVYGAKRLESDLQRSDELTSVYLARYGEVLQDHVEDMAQFCRNAMLNDPDFVTLSFPSSTTSQQISSQFNLRRIIQSRLADSELIVLYNPQTRFLYYAFGDSLGNSLPGPAKRVFVHSSLGTFAERAAGHVQDWQLMRHENGDVFLYTVQSRRTMICACLFDLNDYVRNNPVPVFSGSGFSLIYCGDELISEQGMPQNLNLTADQLTGPVRGYHVQFCDLPDPDLRIAVLTPYREYFVANLRSVIILSTVILLIAAVLIAAHRVLLRLLVLPLEEVAGVSASISASGKAPALTNRSRFKEFNSIHRSILGLVEQKGQLEEEKKGQQLLYERTAFQYFQLQTRSHFILNCLKSLYNMSESGSKEKMQLMISAFSNHLRYIFHDNMGEVPLRAELQEASDYHRIISLDSARPFLFSPEIPPDCLDCLVPPLVIQTFLENTYKYNGKAEGMLVFGVRASVQKMDGENILRLEMYDNGNGYSEESLSELNTELHGSFDQQHIGINNLRRRMQILYGSVCRTVFKNTAEGGACSIIYLPFRRAKETAAIPGERRQP